MQALTRETRYLNALSALKKQATSMSNRKHMRAFIDTFFEFGAGSRFTPKHGTWALSKVAWTVATDV